MTPTALGSQRARCLMIQGTSSDVGKSLLVAGLCRAYAKRGLRVRPFKAQNMSNNAAVTADSDWPFDASVGPRFGEIGRAQALQARACGVAPSIHMNPVLLKPENDIDCQVVLRGAVLGRYSASSYQLLKPNLLPSVLDSLERLRQQADLVLIEGAGSGAEHYLRAQDISNMGLAQAADVPVVLLADESRGGVTAALLGHHLLWSDAERARVCGVVVNKFRGDAAVFAPAARSFQAATGWPLLGLVRWFDAAASLPQEDSLALTGLAASSAAKPGQHQLSIAVLRLPRVANFDDLDPLLAEPSVRLSWVSAGAPIPREADVVLLPGSKATRADLAFLYQQGWQHDLFSHVRHGGYVLGLCAGLQMLGRTVHDPLGVEGAPGQTKGLGLLAIDTVLGAQKCLRQISALDRRSGYPISGFEMHMGQSSGPDMARPWFELDTGAGTSLPEGACSSSGRVMGSYLHGLFGSDAWRRHWLAQLGVNQGGSNLLYQERIEQQIDAYAAQLEADLDLAALYQMAR